MMAKLPILACMLVSLVAPLVVDRICVKVFDPELHKARKAGPPLGPEVRYSSVGGFHFCFCIPYRSYVLEYILYVPKCYLTMTKVWRH